MALAATGGIAIPGGRAGRTGAAQFAVSANGWLTYVERTEDTIARTLVWVDRLGHETAIRVPDRGYAYPRISPDGRRVAVDIRDQEQDIWVWDFDRETLTKLTFHPAADIAPVWTPDGRRIVFFRNGQGLRWQPSDGTGSPESLTQSGPKLKQPRASPATESVSFWKK